LYDYILLSMSSITILQSLYGSYHDFLDRGMPLTRNQLNQGFLVVRLKSSLRSVTVATMTWLTVRISVSKKTTDVPCFVCCNHIPFITSFITYHCVYKKSNTTVGTSTERTAIFPEHMNSPPVLKDSISFSTSPTQNRGWIHVFWKDSISFSTSPTQNRGWVHVFWKGLVEKELLSFQNKWTHPLFCVGLIEKELISF
jgi:hypothetical protein